MKKIFLIISICLFSVSAYAQNADMKLESQDNRTWLDESYKKQFPYPITFGAYGFFNVVSASQGAYKSDSALGGGGAVTAKVSFFRWLAFALDLSYSGASKDYGSGVKENVDTFLFSPMVVFQWETMRGQAGWVPYLGIGVSISNSTIETKIDNIFYGSYNSSSSYAGFGFIMNAGFKYNFKNNAYTGIRADYSASSAGYGTMHNFRLGIEAGYRF